MMSIQQSIDNLMLLEMQREEYFIRDRAPFFIDQGYRIEELELVKVRQFGSFIRDDLSLRIRLDKEPTQRVLMMRRWYRKNVRPYQLPAKPKKEI